MYYYWVTQRPPEAEGEASACAGVKRKQRGREGGRRRGQAWTWQRRRSAHSARAHKSNHPRRTALLPGEREKTSTEPVLACKWKK